MKKVKLDEYTENAIRATDAGKLIPPIVYLPRRLRGQPVRITEDHLRYTLDPPTVAENHVKIAAADPVAFLIAVMHGQPVPEFRVTRGGAIDLYYSVAPFELRVQVARYLADKATMVKRTGGKLYSEDKNAQREYERMVAEANANGGLPDGL